MNDQAGEYKAREKNIHGIKIRNFNLVMMVATCVVYIFLILLTVKVYMDYKDLEVFTENYISCQQDAFNLREGSDYLTEQVRYYAQTGELEYAMAYFEEAEVTRRRDLALEHFREIGLDKSLEDELEEALKKSNELMEIEYYSMRLTAEAHGTDESLLPEKVAQVELTPGDQGLTAEQKEEKSLALVYDDVYQEYKNLIYGHLDTLVDKALIQTDSLKTETADRLTGDLNNQRIMITILFIMNIVMFAFIMALVIRPLRIYIRNIRNDTLFDIVGSYEFKYFALTYNSIYEVNAANRENLLYNSEHDKLTGVLNREAFDSLTRYLEKSQMPITLLMIDVDRFKTVNDTYGHKIGDDVLKKVASQLQSNMRSSDNVIRYGGDEFVVFMADVSKESRGAVLEKVNDINHILMHPDDGLPPVSLSVGAAFSEQGYSCELFRKADEALYRVKNGGRCGVKFADEEE